MLAQLEPLHAELAKCQLISGWPVGFYVPEMCSQTNKCAIKVSKGANIRNRYNQVPHLTQDTNGK